MTALSRGVGLMQTSTSGVSYIYATWNAATKGSDITLSNGNLTAASNYTAVGNHCVVGTIGKSSGKWYWEVRFDALAANSIYPMLGIARASFLSVCSTTDYPGKTADSWGYYGGSGQQYNNATNSAFGAAYAVGDILGFALDADARSCRVYKNGVLQGTWSGIPGTDAIYPVGIESSTVTANFGASMLKFQPPAGYNAGMFATSGLPTFATWNPSDKAASITLANGNLDAANTSTQSTVRSTVGKSSGKWYWEVSVTSGTDYGPMIGCGDASAVLSKYPGNSTNTVGLRADGYKEVSATGSSGPSFALGDIIGFALDMDAGTLTAYKNGVYQGIVATGLTGTQYAMTGGAVGAATVSANFGATPLTYAPPAGYSHGLTSTAYTPAINYATWDVNDKGAGTTLSNGNLTQTVSSNSSVRSNASKNAGAWYWEVTVGTVGNTNATGVEDLGSAISTLPNNAASGMSWNYQAGNIRYNGTSGYAPGTAVAGDVIGLAYNTKTGNLALYKNGGAVWNASISQPSPMFAVSGGSSGSDTANFGATAFKYAPPLGYSWGLGDRPTPFSRSYATWNPSDKAATITLSGGNLVATSSATMGLVRATIGKSTGKWYWELTFNAGSTPLGGVALSTAGLTTAIVSQGTNGIFNNAGNVVYNGSTVNSGTSFISSTLGVALDADAGTVAFYVNGVFQCTASATLSGRPIYPIAGTYLNYAGVCTANFGATPFAYPAPTGYTGLY